MLVYQKTYGSSNDNQDDDDSESVSVVDVSSGNEDYSDAIDNEGGKNDDDNYKLDGLCYSDDEDFLFSIILVTLKTKIERHFRRTPTASISVVLRNQT